ncbi:MAG: hypothetical protein C5B51_28680 [Terriglobia bacterium]|nr:MAG: hypothetical protein C5B51_28680 [Terriglobia bacterium]
MWVAFMRGLALHPRRLCAILSALILCEPAAPQLVQLRHWNGQAVAPVYEGFDTNADGSFNMWFGYMNRNYEEELDIPVGPNNNFEPGGDRGQPTHFQVRRHKDVFKVVVPKDFGDQKLVWTLNGHGQAQQVTGSLAPVWMIDRVRTTRGGNSERVDSNTPPVVNASVSATQTMSATLTVAATDDGLPLRAGKSVGMTVAWAKYRGPGTVTFQPPTAKLAGGQAVTTASFSEAGEYVLQAVVDDGSGELAGNFGYHCCWTNVQLKINVKGGGNVSAQR